MQNIDFQTVRGGGAYVPAPQEIIVLRLKGYCRKYWKREITSLLATQRMKAAIVLVEHYDFKQVDIAELFQVSTKTISRDLESARFYGKQIHNFQKQCDHIYKYLVYNDKYCPLISK